MRNYFAWKAAKNRSLGIAIGVAFCSLLPIGLGVYKIVVAIKEPDASILVQGLSMSFVGAILNVYFWLRYSRFAVLEKATLEHRAKRTQQLNAND